MPASWQLPVFLSRAPVHRKMWHQRLARDSGGSQSVLDLKVGDRQGEQVGLMSAPGPCTTLLTFARLRRPPLPRRGWLCSADDLRLVSPLLQGQGSSLERRFCLSQPDLLNGCCRVAAGFGATAERAFLAKERRALSSVGNRGAPRHARFGGMFVRRHGDEARSTYLRNNPTKSSLGALPTPTLRSRPKVNFKGDKDKTRQRLLPTPALRSRPQVSLKGDKDKTRQRLLPTPALRSSLQVSFRRLYKRDKVETAAHPCSEVWPQMTSAANMPWVEITVCPCNQL